MEEYIKYVVTFISGGVAGTVLNNIIANYNNKIQLMDCEYLEDDIISKLPIVYEKDSHQNLHSKKFKITNTTNKDIEQIKLLFSFEEQCKIVKHVCTTKAGVNFPVGKIFKNNNEIKYYIKKYLDETPHDKVLEDWAKSVEFDKVGVTAGEFVEGFGIDVTPSKKSRKKIKELKEFLKKEDKKQIDEKLRAVLYKETGSDECFKNFIESKNLKDTVRKIIEDCVPSFKAGAYYVFADKEKQNDKDNGDTKDNKDMPKTDKKVETEENNIYKRSGLMDSAVQIERELFRTKSDNAFNKWSKELKSKEALLEGLRKSSVVGRDGWHYSSNTNEYHTLFPFIEPVCKTFKKTEKIYKKEYFFVKKRENSDVVHTFCIRDKFFLVDKERLLICDTANGHVDKEYDFNEFYVD